MRPLLFLAVAAAIMLGLWMVIKPPPVSIPVTQFSEPVQFAISVRNGQVNGPEALRVQQGQSVHIEVTTDVRDELHLHGYDLHLPLKAGIPAHLGFQAERSGRFELELHDSHLGLGNLEVYPAP